MDKERNALRWLTERAGLPCESLPGQSLIEIADNCRVFVENHRGVKEYSREHIRIQGRNGLIDIFGCCLELRSMTKDQLLVQGTIHSVQFPGSKI